MANVVTVMGAGGLQVPVTVNGSVAFTLAQAYQSAISQLSASLFAQNLTAGVAPAGVPGGETGEGMISTHGSYTFPGGYSYVTNNASGGVSLDASMIGSSVSVLAGLGGTTLFGGAGGGEFVSGGGNNIFEGLSTGGGAYKVVMSAGNDSVFANSGNDTIYTDAGRNTIFAGTGNDTIYSGGTDSIVAGAGSSTIALTGVGSTVFGSTGATTLVDVGTDGEYSGGTGPTLLYDGTAGTYYLNGQSTVIGGYNDTISASANATVFSGSNTVLYDNGSVSLAFIANSGTASTVAGATNATVYGASDAIVTFDGASSGLSYLIASTGNETLDGALSGGNLMLFGNGAASELDGGAGNDTLVAGSGSNTLSGGQGSNTFIFSDTSSGGHDVIADFGSSAGNLVGLFGYGANEARTVLAAAVDNASGGSSITLSDNTVITFNNLTADQLKAHGTQIFST